MDKVNSLSASSHLLIFIPFMLFSGLHKGLLALVLNSVCLTGFISTVNSAYSRIFKANSYQEQYPLFATW